MKKKNTLNYLLRNKALNVLVFWGIFGGIPFLHGQEISDSSPVIQQNVVTQNSLVNPFTFEHIGAPFRGIPVDRLGMPKLLEMEDALSIINKVFEEEGINLEKNYYYKKDGISVVLDGFDTNLNIGYLWIAPYSIGAKMNNMWHIKYYDQVMYKQFLKPKIDAGYTPDKVDELERKLKKMKKDKKYVPNLDQSMEIAKNYPEGPLQTYKHLLWEILSQKHQGSRNEPAITYFNEYFNTPGISREAEKSINDGLISNCNRINYFDEKEVLAEILNDIVRLEDEAEKRKQYNNFVEFLLLNQYYKIRKNNEYNPTQEILATEDKKSLAEAIQAFGFEHLDKKLSLREARLLDNIHQTKNFIAPISMEDRRFQYRPLLNNEEEKAINKLRTVRKNFSEEEYNQAYLEIASRASERTKNNALKYLETQVRQYIQWAKQQAKH